MIEQKEVEDFAVRLAGAFTGALEDAAIEGNYKANPAPGAFPYITLNPNIPPVDDLLVGGLALPPWVIGLLVEEDAKKKGDAKTQQMARGIRIFGEGDVCYSVPMLVYTTLMRLTHSGFDPGWAARVGHPALNRPIPPMGQTGPPMGQIVVKL